MTRMDDGPEYDTQRAMAAFVRARLDEDETLARRGAEGFMGLPDGPESWHTVTCGTGLGYWANSECSCDVPARVLAECEAKRSIVDLADVWRGDANDYGVADRAVQIVAAAYADHPDYRDEWRP